MERPQEIPIQYLKGIGPKRAKLFENLGIRTIEDILYYFPRRYEDRSKFVSISKLKEGVVQAVKARIKALGERHSWRKIRFNILEIAVADDTGQLRCVFFNQGYLREYFKPDVRLILYGKVERYAGNLQMSSPEFEIITNEGDESLNSGRIVPVYSLPQGLNQRLIRKVIKKALDEYLPVLNDFLPYNVRSRNNLLNLAKSLINIHYPQDQVLQKEAYKRLSFEEFFIFQVPLALRKIKKKELPGIAHKTEGKLFNNFIAGLPFKLTASQEKVIAEIKSDMARPAIMQRLLQGDVGSGKTVVAMAAAFIAIQGGYQVAFMVPTEILAQQHYDKINSGLSVKGSDLDKIKVVLLTGGLNYQEKNRIYAQIRKGEINLIIGTHSLLEEKVNFSRLGLVVIDEQHKFGVGQRSLLPQKGLKPDVLIMTATPIPRTLAITLYGDLDVSVINELPAGRIGIKTLSFKQEDKKQAYEIARQRVKQGDQVYIIYPVIDDSDALDIAGAKKMYEQLKNFEFRGLRLGLIHGRLKEKEQQDLMNKFKDVELDILVATTILEVGIDIPNATCMIIEHAERFGLSQLHQLRGRVGRGSKESFCILVSDAPTEEAKQRLEAMVKYSDGFRIAEEDL
ncbi:MAG: ATP-dependent DNA helicase RecG, partial [Candidatus Omnitrophica bacterium]|nr:ATP-dependent DNA helicase RecG [Candidatus Omnitrophota bacterium]